MNSTERRTDVRTEGDRVLRVTRVFDAPRELVFKAWTDRDALMNWWGPREWPLAHCTLDLRVGGRWHYCMKGPNGEEAWGLGVYTEITPVSRLAYVDTFSDAEGSANPPETLMTVELEDLGDGRTRMNSTAEFASEAQRKQVMEMGMVEGLTESLDRLDEHLAA